MITRQKKKMDQVQIISMEDLVPKEKLREEINADRINYGKKEYIYDEYYDEYMSRK